MHAHAESQSRTTFLSLLTVVSLSYTCRSILSGLSYYSGMPSHAKVSAFAGRAAFVLHVYECSLAAHQQEKGAPFTVLALRVGVGSSLKTGIMLVLCGPGTTIYKLSSNLIGTILTSCRNSKGSKIRT